MKFLVDPESMEKYIFYSEGALCMCRIDSFKPLIFKEIFYNGSIYDYNEKPKVFKEMEEFALKKAEEFENRF